MRRGREPGQGAWAGSRDRGLTAVCEGSGGAAPAGALGHQALPRQSLQEPGPARQVGHRVHVGGVCGA